MEKLKSQSLNNNIPINYSGNGGTTTSTGAGSFDSTNHNPKNPTLKLAAG